MLYKEKFQIIFWVCLRKYLDKIVRLVLFVFQLIMWENVWEYYLNLLLKIIYLFIYSFIHAFIQAFIYSTNIWSVNIYPSA